MRWRHSKRAERLAALGSNLGFLRLIKELHLFHLTSMFRKFQQVGWLFDGNYTMWHNSWHPLYSLWYQLSVAVRWQVRQYILCFSSLSRGDNGRFCSIHSPMFHIALLFWIPRAIFFCQHCQQDNVKTYLINFLPDGVGLQSYSYTYYDVRVEF